VPHDTALKFSIASRDLRLGDETGAQLAATASPQGMQQAFQQTFQQTFQHTTGDPKPKSFGFSVLGLLP